MQKKERPRVEIAAAHAVAAEPAVVGADASGPPEDFRQDAVGPPFEFPADCETPGIRGTPNRRGSRRYGPKTEQVIDASVIAPRAFPGPPGGTFCASNLGPGPLEEAANTR